jgi:hypothetical protein
MARSSNWATTAAVLLLIAFVGAEAVKARTAPKRPAAPPASGAPAPEPGPPPEPAQRFHGLLSADETQVRARIGSPDVTRAEGAGAMWTYRLPECALFVFFRLPKDAAPGEPIRVSGAASGPRVRGRTPPPVNDCIAQAISRQTGQGHG